MTFSRNKALNALEAWPQASLPAEAVAILAEAKSREPEKELQDRLAQLLEQLVEKH